jgi:hypothetical protein
MRISGRLALLLGVTVALVAVSVVALVGGRHGESQAVGPAPRSAGPVAAVQALEVLRDWDAARSRAWGQGNGARLRGLYVAGSTAGRRDVAMLGRWADRGLRVQGMSMQVLGVRLEVRKPRRIVLVVTDRLVAAYALGRGRRYPLPRDNASTRRLEFRRVDGRWLLASVGHV